MNVITSTLHYRFYNLIYMYNREKRLAGIYTTKRILLDQDAKARFELATVYLERQNQNCYWYTHFFYKQRIFSRQPQYCSTFKWIQSQMLLKRCLLHINMILPTHTIFCIVLSLSTSRSINYRIIFLCHFYFHWN